MSDEQKQSTEQSKPGDEGLDRYVRTEAPERRGLFGAPKWVLWASAIIVLLILALAIWLIVRSKEADERRITAIAISPNSSLRALGKANGQIEVQTQDSNGRYLQYWQSHGPRTHRASIKSLSFGKASGLPGEDILASSDEEGKILIWPVRSDSDWDAWDTKCVHESSFVSLQSGNVLAVMEEDATWYYQLRFKNVQRVGWILTTELQKKIGQ